MLKLNLSRAITSALLAAFMAGAGAAEAPQPGLAVPERFISVPADATLASNGEVEFWRSFGDAQLTALVERALHENHDLRIALAHFESANALLRGARLDRFPIVTAQANASNARLSADQAALAGGERTSKRGFRLVTVLESDEFSRVVARRSVQRLNHTLERHLDSGSVGHGYG